MQQRVDQLVSSHRLLVLQSVIHSDKGWRTKHVGNLAPLPQITSPCVHDVGESTVRWLLWRTPRRIQIRWDRIQSGVLCHAWVPHYPVIRCVIHAESWLYFLKLVQSLLMRTFVMPSDRGQRRWRPGPGVALSRRRLTADLVRRRISLARVGIGQCSGVVTVFVKRTSASQRARMLIAGVVVGGDQMTVSVGVPAQGRMVLCDHDAVAAVSYWKDSPTGEL